MCDPLSSLDLLGMDLPPEIVAQLLRGRTAIHCDELADLLWQLDQDRRGGER